MNLWLEVDRKPTETQEKPAGGRNDPQAGKVINLEIQGLHFVLAIPVLLDIVPSVVYGLFHANGSSKI
ncbi:MAG: hypothetical protein ACRED1_07230 [Limisphaerales bacterium]